MKKILSVFLLAMLPALSHAASTDPLMKQVFTNPDVQLTSQERAALAINNKWVSADAVQPAVGSDGAINFVFGAQKTSIVCAVLQVCDVTLQPGEQVNSLELGDSVRWSVTPAISGTGSNETQHMIIKPLDVGLETSLVVTTNRRTYYLTLRSTKSEFMSHVSFTYPEDAQAKWEALRATEAKKVADNTIPTTGEYLGNLNFNYTISGTAPWKPLRVYNDGKKTIIQMPELMSQTDAPTLLVVRKDGGVFSKEETAIVNYRVQGDRYIVDNLFKKAEMISGVGSSQDRITIEQNEGGSSAPSSIADGGH